MGRDTVLAAVRAALAGVVPPTLPAVDDARDRRAPAHDDVRALARRFADEARAVGAVVHAASTRDAAARTLRQIVSDLPASRVAVWPTPLARDVTTGALAGAAVSIDVVGADGPTEVAAAADIGVTEADALVAASGTLVLRSAGRARAVSLLPPVHVAIVPVARLVPDLGAALAAVRGDGDPESCITLITGPSRTADIEKKLVVGVHGPCALHVVLLDEGAG